MRTTRFLTCALFLIGATASQTAVSDVGLTMTVNNSAMLGQACGAIACAPVIGSQVNLNQVLDLTHWGAPNSPFVLAISLPGGCIPFPGIANSLLLDPASMQTLTVGVTSSAVPTLFCPQLEGRAGFALSMPASAPIPIPFRLQSLGMSNNGLPAFTRALELILL